MTDPTKPHLCTCGSTHRVRVSRHTLHAGLVEALKKFRDVCKARKSAGRLDWNHIHIRRDLPNLTRDEENNLSKLAFLGLLVHRKRGDWGLAPLAVEFLNGTARVQEGVETVDKKPIRRFGPMMSIKSFEKQIPVFTVDAPKVEQERQQQLV